MLGCQWPAEDSIEHYARCNAVREVASKLLRIDNGHEYDLQRFMIAEKGDPEDSTLICRAVLVYATYMATNHFRHGYTGIPSTRTAVEALEQYCRNAVRDHSSSERAIDGRWLVGPTQQTKRQRTN